VKTAEREFIYSNLAQQERENLRAGICRKLETASRRNKP
jgi:hypothetical protein